MPEPGGQWLREARQFGSGRASRPSFKLLADKLAHLYDPPRRCGSERAPREVPPRTEHRERSLCQVTHFGSREARTDRARLEVPRFSMVATGIGRRPPSRLAVP